MNERERNRHLFCLSRRDLNRGVLMKKKHRHKRVEYEKRACRELSFMALVCACVIYPSVRVVRTTPFVDEIVGEREREKFSLLTGHLSIVPYANVACTLCISFCSPVTVLYFVSHLTDMEGSSE